MDGIIKGKRKCEVLAEYLMAFGYGETVSHEQIAQVINEKYNSFRYRTVVQQARKILLEEHKISFESIRGEGYRRVKADDFTKQTLGHYKRGFNAIQTGMNILQNAPVEDMTEQGREVYRHVYDRTAQLEASMKGAIVEVKTLREKKHPLLPKP